MKRPTQTSAALKRFDIESGVAAVVDPSLEMRLDEFGLYRSVRNDSSDIGEPALEPLLAVNAMSDQSPNEDEVGQRVFGNTLGMQHDAAIGHYLSLYAGFVREGNYRTNGSSGGMTTWILVQLLKRGLVDGVIHFKPTVQGSPILFEYTISRTPAEVIAGAKSRYYPGEVSSVLREVQRAGGRYAITGIPSFITELRLLAHEMPELGDSLPFMVGLICGHQKSTHYTDAMAWQHGIRPGDLTSVDYRVKDLAKPASQYLIRMDGTIDGVPVSMTKSQLDFFVGNWGHGFFKPTFSDYTDDVFNETADIALGDAWLQPYVKDGAGTNVVVVRDPVIQDILEDGIATGTIHLEPLTPEQIISSQKGLIHHNQDEIGYRLHREDERGEWRPEKRIQPDPSLSFLRKRVQDVREKIADRSHVEYREAVHKADWSSFERAMKPLVVQYRIWYLCIMVTNKSIGNVIRAVLNRLRNKRW